jgi:hypothetical protein
MDGLQKKIKHNRVTESKQGNKKTTACVFNVAACPTSCVQSNHARRENPKQMTQQSRSLVSRFLAMKQCAAQQCHSNPRGTKASGGPVAFVPIAHPVLSRSATGQPCTHSVQMMTAYKRTAHHKLSTRHSRVSRPCQRASWSNCLRSSTSWRNKRCSGSAKPRSNRRIQVATAERRPSPDTTRLGFRVSPA